MEVRLFGLLNLALVLALFLPGRLWIETRPEVVEIEGDLPLEFSYLEERGWPRRDRLYLCTPRKGIETTATPQVLTLTEEEIQQLEGGTLEEINELRGIHEINPLMRLVVLDPAALMGASYAAAYPDRRLTHSVPMTELLEIPIDLLRTVRIPRKITEADLAAIGARVEPGYVARSNTRVTLANHMLGGSPEENPARQGGTSEVAVRGSNLTPEIIRQAFEGSPPHLNAILNEDYEYAGVTALQGEEGIISVFIILDKGLNENANREESNGRLVYAVFIPVASRNQ